MKLTVRVELQLPGHPAPATAERELGAQAFPSLAAELAGQLGPDLAGRSELLARLARLDPRLTRDFLRPL